MYTFRIACELRANRQQSALNEGPKTGRLRICRSSGEVTLGADSICQRCVCSDTYEEDQQTRQQRLRTLRDYYRRLERFGTTTAEEEQDRQLLEAEDLAQRLADLEHEVRSGQSRIGHEKRTSVVEALDNIARLADGALTFDPKLAALVAEVRNIRAAEPDANVLVYTEYVTSQEVAAAALRFVGTVLTMSGEDDEKTRAHRQLRGT